MTAPQYRQAPLPFTGQKRRFLTLYKRLLHECIPADGAGWTVLDVFGGSGLLSHIARHELPAATVIYNDFEDYATRLTHIDDTNRLRRQLLVALADVPHNGRLPPAVRAVVHNLIRGFDGFVDYDALSAWLLFSGKVASRLDSIMRNSNYNRVRQTDYPTAAHYLDGITVIRADYRDLLPRYTGQPRVLQVLDPPYVNTTQDGYHKADYFGMVAFLQLMRMVRPPYIMFSSTRSEFPAWLDLTLQEHLDGWQNFTGYRTATLKATLNQSATYEDNVVYKF